MSIARGELPFVELGARRGRYGVRRYGERVCSLLQISKVIPGPGSRCRFLLWTDSWRHIFPGAQTTKPIATLLVSEQEVKDQAQSMDT